MAAYVTAEIELRDPGLFERYRAPAPATIATHGGRCLARGGASEVIEGGLPAKMIVVPEFPSMAAARGWYNSADHAEVRAISKNALRRQLIFVEGIVKG